jgi:protein-tyrosine phosphatase
LSAAAEYMIDDYFLELLKTKSPLLTLHKNILLTEISYSTAPVNLQAITTAIIAEGYKPILAHPERYHFYHYNPGIYFNLKEMGFHLQVNLLSLTGYYGKNVKKAATFLIKKNLASLVATDLHHKYHLSALSDPKNRAILHEVLGNKTYNDLEALASQ